MLTAIFLAVYINSMVVVEAALHHTSIFIFVLGNNLINQSFKQSFRKISHSHRMLLLRALSWHVVTGGGLVWKYCFNCQASSP